LSVIDVFNYIINPGLISFLNKSGWDYILIHHSDAFGSFSPLSHGDPHSGGSHEPRIREEFCICLGGMDQQLMLLTLRAAIRCPNLNISNLSNPQME